MKKFSISSSITVFETIDELNEKDQQLVISAEEACKRAYAPYSAFNVGAAVRLINGEIIQGNNQENAAYPSGLCAERVALFYANSLYPDVAVEAIAVIAGNENGILKNPVAPCGSCRQVMLETELRMKQSFYTLLIGAKEIHRVENTKDLLPLTFTGEGVRKKIK